MDDKSSDDNYDSLPDSEDAQDEQVKIETKILNGLNRYVLPKIGPSVKTLVLECSRALTNGLVRDSHSHSAKSVPLNFQ